MVRVTQKDGRKKSYKDHDTCVNAYKRKGYVCLIHKRTGNKRFFKIR